MSAHVAQIKCLNVAQIKCLNVAKIKGRKRPDVMIEGVDWIVWFWVL